MKYIGGYSILDLNDTTNVSKQANACYNQDKPVLVYGANGERYFADTITKSGTNIVITKGGKTITIANDNTITSVGDIKTYNRYKIKIITDRAVYWSNTMISDMPFELNTDLDITEELYYLLSYNDVIIKNVVEEENGEFVAVLYDENDPATFKIDTRYLDEGVITEGIETISKVNFRLIQ